MQIHPHDNIKGCVVAQAGDLQDGKSVILIEPNPSVDFLKNWNKGKYDTVYIEGQAIFAGENTEIFNKVASVTGYTFKPDAIIWLDKMIPVNERALPAPQKKSKALVEVRSPAEGQPLITLK